MCKRNLTLFVAYDISLYGFLCHLCNDCRSWDTTVWNVCCWYITPCTITLDVSWAAPLFCIHSYSSLAISDFARSLFLCCFAYWRFRILPAWCLWYSSLDFFLGAAWYVLFEKGIFSAFLFAFHHFQDSFVWLWKYEIMDSYFWNIGPEPCCIGRSEPQWRFEWATVAYMTSGNDFSCTGW